MKYFIVEYEIFYSVEDNVGNILDRVYFGKINPHFLKFCPSNCSSNGACNTTYGVCECFQNYFGDDCSKTIDDLDQSLTVLLNNLNVQLQFRQTAIRNLYDFEVYILTHGIVSLKVINLPEEILFLNGIKLEWILPSESSNVTLKFKLKVPFNYSNSFVLQLLIEFKNQTETTKVNYDVYLESYLIKPEILLTVDCYDRERENNIIDLLFTSLDDQDEVEIILMKVDPYLNLTIQEYSNFSKDISINVTSAENSFVADIYLSLSFNKNYKEAYNLSYVFSYESCPLREIDTTESITTLDLSLVTEIKETSLNDQTTIIESTTSFNFFSSRSFNQETATEVTSNLLTQFETSSADNQVSIVDSISSYSILDKSSIWPTTSETFLLTTLSSELSTSNSPDTYSTTTIDVTKLSSSVLFTDNFDLTSIDELTSLKTTAASELTFTQIVTNSTVELISNALITTESSSSTSSGENINELTTSNNESTHLSTQVNQTDFTEQKTTQQSTNTLVVTENNDSKLYFYLIIGGSVLILASIVLVLICCFKNKKKRI